MTRLEICLVVGGTVALRPFIKDNVTYFLVCLGYGAVLGAISGLTKGLGDE